MPDRYDEPHIKLPLMQMVKNRQPPPHHRCLVGREGRPFVATPCYGMHGPWWVPMTAEGELEPVDMLESDVWAILTTVPA